MRTVSVESEGYAAAAAAVRRAGLETDPEVERVVAGIVAEVRARGDEALLDLGRRFDCPGLGALEVSADEWEQGCAAVPGEVKAALDRAAANIRAFHEQQRRPSWMDAREGAVTGQVVRALDRVGLYVPGGTAVYPSSVLMVGVPARVAGVSDIVMTTPAARTGEVHPSVLYAARAAGVSRVFRVGGAQAVAALAYGTRTVPAVDKVVGPGNVYVNAAKKLLWGVVDVDMLAGPSEVCVVADDGANPAFAAADLLTQAEHDADCAAYLLTPSARLAVAVAREIDQRMADLPRRGLVARALEAHGAIVVTRTLDEALDLANVCAPEHLALMVRDPFAALAHVRNAGAVLLGDYSPQTLGDYLAGPSHTLPTSGTARFASPLHVDTFLKKSSFIYYDRAALAAVGGLLVRFAEDEGFGAHAQAVRARLAPPEGGGEGMA